MSHRNVVLRDEYGDLMRGVEHDGHSAAPEITVNGTTAYVTTWTREGWDVVEVGEWMT